MPSARKGVGNRVRARPSQRCAGGVERELRALLLLAQSVEKGVHLVERALPRRAEGRACALLVANAGNGKAHLLLGQLDFVARLFHLRLHRLQPLPPRRRVDARDATLRLLLVTPHAGAQLLPPVSLDASRERGRH